MTRWARAGNTQKHKKMPGDATSWEEFSGQVKKNISEKFIKKHTSKGRSTGSEKMQNESADKSKVLDLSTKALDLSTSNLNLFKPSTTPIKKIEHSLGSDSSDVPTASILSRMQTEKQGKFLRLSMSKKLQKEGNNTEQNQRMSKAFVKEDSCSTPDLLDSYKLEKKMSLKNHSVKTFFPKTQYNENEVSACSNVSLNPDARINKKKIKNKLLKRKLKKQKFANQHQNCEDLEAGETKYFNETKECSVEGQGIGQNQSGVQELDLADSVQQRKKLKAWKKIKRKQFQDDKSFVKEKQCFNQNHFAKAFPPDIQNNTDEVSALSDISSEAQGIGKKEKSKFLKKLKKQKLANQHKDSKDFDVLENEYSSETKHYSSGDEKNNQQNLYSIEDSIDPLQLKKNSKALKRKQIQGTEDSDAAQSVERGKKCFKQNEVSSNRDNKKSVENTTKESKNKRKKKLYLRKKKMERAEKGIILLPSKVERKLYLIKKKLREKGLAPEVLKEIIRKERRKEELKFRKTFSSKVCFNCRQKGHILAECPVPLQNSKPKSGMCFKCGSTEHMSFKCTKNVEGFPLAECFICKEQGHISRECPQNKHGIYPKGGKCSMCGNVNHLRKDCPSLKKKDEQTVTAHTLNESTSVDAEIVENVSKKVFKKKPKIIKF